MASRAVPIDMYASERHFVDHLAAVRDALPRTWRGAFGTGSQAAAARAGELGIQPVQGLPEEDRPVLVAAIGDHNTARKRGRSRVALMEHGAGQSYGGDPRAFAARHPSFAGGKGRDADLFLHPGPHPAARDRERYPDARIEVVGSPRLDMLPERIAPEPGEGPVIAVSFHWDSLACPETQTTFVAFRDGVKALADRYQVLGHGHPRIIDRLTPWYERRGIEVVRSFDEVCARADLYVCDNSSTLYEFAATGRPVIVLSPPLYRRRVHHGLRFWDAIPGPECHQARSLVAAVADALPDPPAQRAAREAALDLVYAHRSGAAKRAAAVLRDWARGPARDDA